jgi:aspartyl-tRNA(Asn)/glutamyl-tRNA(Gln) amidotransferase subunit A
VVEKLDAAGAVLIGKTGLHEMAYGITSNNPHYGAVHNPWNLECITGGSSGGSGAAVAAGLIRWRPAPILADRFASPARFAEPPV